MEQMAASRPALALATVVSGMVLVLYGRLPSTLPSSVLQRTQSLHTQVNIMGGAGPDGYPQGYGGYAMPVDTSIPPIKGARGRHSFPFPSPASAPNAPPAQEIDTSKFVRRSEEDTRFRLLESRLHVDEGAMERMRETIRKLKSMIERNHK